MMTEPSNMDLLIAGIILPVLLRIGLNLVLNDNANFNLIFTAIPSESMMFFTSAENLAGLNTLGKDDQVEKNFFFPTYTDFIGFFRVT